MQAIREVKRVFGNQITIELPDSFHAKKVEVIVIPFQSMSTVPEKTDWKNDFLSISQWEVSEDDIKMKSWPVQEF